LPKPDLNALIAYGFADSPLEGTGVEPSVPSPTGRPLANQLDGFPLDLAGSALARCHDRGGGKAVTVHTEFV
jgi:hypothetical protein